MNSYAPLPDAPPAINGQLNLLRRNKSISPLAPQASEAVKLAFWIQWLAAMTVQLSLLLWLTSEKTGDLGPQYRSLAVITLLASVPLYGSCRAFSVHGGYLAGLSRLLAGWCALLGLLALIAFITKTSALFSREVILLWATGGFALQAATFFPLHKVATRLDIAVKSSRRSLIVGTDDLALTLVAALNEPLIGLVEVDDFYRNADDLENSRFIPYPVLGKVSHLRSLLREHRISRVYIALPAQMTEQIEGLYVDLLDFNVDVVWVPDVANLLLLNHSIQNVGGLPAVHLNESPLTSHPGSALVKVAGDRLLALLGIVLLSPVMLAIAIAVKLSSPGPILFRQQRHGMNGNIIEVLKFRSMRVHDDSEVKQAQRNDSRVTAVGRVIRRTSLDELPQLFNVLKGDMSLVGPRPHAVAHNDYYSSKIKAYMARHRIKPGITGHAQINGCRGETETLAKMQKRVELDLEYINNWSLWLDLKILIKTPLSLFSKDIY